MRRSQDKCALQPERKRNHWNIPRDSRAAGNRGQYLFDIIYMVIALNQKMDMTSKHLDSQGITGNYKNNQKKILALKNTTSRISKFAGWV